MRLLPNCFRAVLAALLALLCLLTPVSAQAALITDVADAADGDDPLDVDIDLRWRRFKRTALITREHLNPGDTKTINASELKWERWTHVLDASLAIGLFHDLELHANIPYVVHDEQYWDYHVDRDGVSSEANSTIRNESRNADNELLPEARPLMTVPGRVYRGGFLEPSVGIAWGIFNGEREKRLDESWFPHKIRTATWVLGFDYHMPIVAVADPSRPDPSQPAPNADLPLGHGAHRLDWWMAMSKRVGIVEPFMKLHYTLPVTSIQAYDNCKIVGKDDDNFVMSTKGQELCQPNSPDDYWKGKTGLQHPHVGGLLVGAEIIPIEEKDGLRLSIGIQASADFVSKGRWHTEVSDALRKLTYSDQYFSIDGRLTFDLRFSKWVHVVTYLSIGTDTPHVLTSESVGKDRFGEHSNDPADGKVTIGSNEMSPNYDFRIDQPGRRLRVTGVSVFGASTMLSINF